MKKYLVQSIIVVLLLTLMVPSAVYAKNVRTDKISPHWEGFSYEFSGTSGSGSIAINDNNKVFDYVLSSPDMNGSLSNGQVITIGALNRGKNVVKTMEITVEGLSGEDMKKGFGCEFGGYNGEGTIKITDNSDKYDFELKNPELNGRLLNGQAISINVLNDNKVTTSFSITVKDLEPVENTAFTFISDSRDSDCDAWVFRFRNGCDYKVRIVAKAYVSGSPVVFDGEVPANTSLFFDVPKEDYTSKPTIVLKYYDMDGDLIGQITK